MATAPAVSVTRVIAPARMEAAGLVTVTIEVKAAPSPAGGVKGVLVENEKPIRLSLKEGYVPISVMMHLPFLEKYSVMPALQNIGLTFGALTVVPPQGACEAARADLVGVTVIILVS